MTISRFSLGRKLMGILAAAALLTVVAAARPSPSSAGIVIPFRTGTGVAVGQRADLRPDLTVTAIGQNWVTIQNVGLSTSGPTWMSIGGRFRAMVGLGSGVSITIRDDGLNCGVVALDVALEVDESDETNNQARGHCIN